MDGQDQTINESMYKVFGATDMVELITRARKSATH